MSRSTSKAKISTSWPRAASEAGLGGWAWAAMALIVGEAWCEELVTGETWVCRLGVAGVAERMGVALSTARRAIRDLEAAGLITKLHGDGRSAAFAVAPELAEIEAPPKQEAARQRAGRPLASERADRRDAGGRSLYQSISPTSTSSAHVRTASQHRRHGGGGGGGDLSRSLSSRAVGGEHADRDGHAPRRAAHPDRPPAEPVRTPSEPRARSDDPRPIPKPEPSTRSQAASGEVIAQIVERPAWVSDGAWVDRRTAEQLARAPGVTADTVRWALKLTRERRTNLRNPAGYFVRQLRDPDIDDVQRFIRADEERRRRAETRPTPPPAPPPRERVTAADMLELAGSSGRFGQQFAERLKGGGMSRPQT